MHLCSNHKPYIQYHHILPIFFFMLKSYSSNWTVHKLNLYILIWFCKFLWFYKTLQDQKIKYRKRISSPTPWNGYSMVLSKPINETNNFFFLLLGINENIVPITKNRRTKSELLILMLLDLHVSFSFFCEWLTCPYFFVSIHCPPSSHPIINLDHILYMEILPSITNSFTAS